MSYARFGDDSDVFVYVYDDKNGNDRLTCQWCSLCKTYDTDSIQEMIEHLELHKNRGDKVPYYTIEALEFDHARYGELCDHEKNGYYDKPYYNMGLPDWAISILEKW